MRFSFDSPSWNRFRAEDGQTAASRELSGSVADIVSALERIMSRLEAQGASHAEIIYQLKSELRIIKYSVGGMHTTR